MHRFHADIVAVGIGATIWHVSREITGIFHTPDRFHEGIASFYSSLSQGPARTAADFPSIAVLAEQLGSAGLLCACASDAQ
jgi:hypothetical protein